MVTKEISNGVSSETLREILEEISEVVYEVIPRGFFGKYPNSSLCKIFEGILERNTEIHVEVLQNISTSTT